MFTMAIWSFTTRCKIYFLQYISCKLRNLFFLLNILNSISCFITFNLSLIKKAFRSKKLGDCFLRVSTKRYFKIDLHLARHFVYYVECFSSPPPFQCNKIITSFLNSIIYTNQEKGLEVKAIVKLLYPYSCSSIELILFYQLIKIPFWSYLWNSKLKALLIYT